MWAITEWLLKTLTTCTPSIDLVVDFGILDYNWSHDWTDGFRRLLYGCSAGFLLFCVFVFKFLEMLDVEMGEIGVGKLDWGILWLLNPTLWFYVFQFSNVENNSINKAIHLLTSIDFIQLNYFFNFLIIIIELWSILIFLSTFLY